MCSSAPYITCDLSYILFFGRLTLYSAGSHLHSPFPRLAHSVPALPTLSCLANNTGQTIHYHLLESEWIYILRGTAILQHIDSSLQHITPSPTLAPTNAPNTPIPWTTGNPNLDVVETELKSGDFAGWPAGLQSASWAHGLRAGPTGVEYLMGGSREKFDICVYPRLGKAMISDEKFPDGKEFTMAQVPVFPHLYSTDREYEQAQGKGRDDD
jgi:uncharacterized cupin superfamily protein